MASTNTQRTLEEVLAENEKLLYEANKYKALVQCFFTGEVNPDVRSIEAAILAAYGKKRKEDNKRNARVLASITANDNDLNELGD